jgi:hypothetical protein
MRRRCFSELGLCVPVVGVRHTARTERRS